MFNVEAMVGKQQNRKSGSGWWTLCIAQTGLLEILANLLDPVACAMVQDFLQISLEGVAALQAQIAKLKFWTKSLHEPASLKSWKIKHFQYLMWNQALEKCVGVWPWLHFADFWISRFFEIFIFWALWTCHHTLPNLLFYWENDYFWLICLKWFEKNEFLNVFEMIWKRKPCA